ncbi:MAG: hypothetical protein ACR2NR_22240 [Solirubrobacteraceae bacterium]
MDGDDAVQTRAPPAPDEQLLVVERLGQLPVLVYTATMPVCVGVPTIPLAAPPPEPVLTEPLLAPVAGCPELVPVPDAPVPVPVVPVLEPLPGVRGVAPLPVPVVPGAPVVGWVSAGVVVGVPIGIPGVVGGTVGVVVEGGSVLPIGAVAEVGGGWKWSGLTSSDSVGGPAVSVDSRFRRAVPVAVGLAVAARPVWATVGDAGAAVLGAGTVGLAVAGGATSGGWRWAIAAWTTR